jgi:hypothetical protein
VGALTGHLAGGFGSANDAGEGMIGARVPVRSAAMLGRFGWRQGRENVPKSILRDRAGTDPDFLVTNDDLAGRLVHMGGDVAGFDVEHGASIGGSVRRELVQVL